MAYKNKMEISMGVAVGSATQIALFVIPACVVVGWAADVDLDLDFSVFDTMAMVSSVLVVVMIIQHGESHWLHGLMLVTAYIIVAGAYWVHVDESLE
jgi:Ca2+:H+ antiporter